MEGRLIVGGIAEAGCTNELMRYGCGEQELYWAEFLKVARLCTSGLAGTVAC